MIYFNNHTPVKPIYFIVKTLYSTYAISCLTLIPTLYKFGNLSLGLSHLSSLPISCSQTFSSVVSIFVEIGISKLVGEWIIFGYRVLINRQYMILYRNIIHTDNQTTLLIDRKYDINNNNLLGIITKNIIKYMFLKKCLFWRRKKDSIFKFESAICWRIGSSW